MQKLFQIILDKYPDIDFSIYVNHNRNICIKIDTITEKSSIEIPISNLEDDSFDWESIANILLNSLS